MKLLLSLLVGCLAWGAVQAQTTYRWIDPQTGQTVFSDKPPPAGVKQVSKKQLGAAAEGEEGSLPYATRRAVENFPVVLYTSSDCVETCRLGRDLLNARGVPFREKMIATPEDYEELKRVAGSEPAVPILMVGKQTTRGVDSAAWNNLLDLAGYPKTAPYGFKPRGALEK